MKYTAATSLVLLASASAFAPSANNGRVSVAREALADKIFGMDLFEPNKEQNDYGARSKKNIKVGTLGSNSYVPAGLSKAEYEKIRAGEAKKKEENYQRNVKKAGVFTDFTEWYAQRGTELGGDWKKKVTLGHRMAKTKYDWSGVEDAKKFESTKADGFLDSFKGKKVVAKKAAPTKTAPKKKTFWS